MAQREFKKLMGLIEAILAVTGVRVHPSTAWRWSTKGSKGVILRTWMLGGRRVTTCEACETFIRERQEVGVESQTRQSPTRQKLETELYKSKKG